MASEIKLTVISGPSGAGKSTLLKKLFKEYPDYFAYSVSHTTRAPRPREQPGREYYFVSKQEFEDLKNKDGFLEHTQFSGNMYGTSKKSIDEIRQTGKICILDVDINAVKNIKKSDLKAKYIFVNAPNMTILEERLRGRGTEKDESIQKRLDSAKEALEYAEQPGSYDHILINDDLNDTYAKFKRIFDEDIEKLKASSSPFQQLPDICAIV